ncbi:hypothetical protein CC86DRAFT_132736 [Ophiobolus disseminans]|uniref:Uncharacterized protein n=1 Tax=Ophiobolus disseminans TaxID=1469910 RepID=A0A6A6ZFL8_9PLEO|nr:hypothetical protein CC86DRAFT_132736 [Ophiobolus disseminans]
MTGSMYFGDTTQPQHYPSGQRHSFPFDSTNAIELYVQQDIQQSLLSPTIQQHQRQDSMFPTSPSAMSKPGVSPQQHQAEPQPYVSTAQPTPHAVPHVPVSMSRSASHYSTSSGQQLHHIRQHRVSLDGNSRPSATDMSRSSTQYSNNTTGYHYQAEDHPCGSVAMANQDYASTVMARIPGHFSSNQPSYDSAQTNANQSTYDFDGIGAFDASTLDIGNMGRLFGHTPATEPVLWGIRKPLPAGWKPGFSRPCPASPDISDGILEDCLVFRSLFFLSKHGLEMTSFDSCLTNDVGISNCHLGD